MTMPKVWRGWVFNFKFDYHWKRELSRQFLFNGDFIVPLNRQKDLKKKNLSSI